jgi:uncharacterized membrane protein
MENSQSSDNGKTVAVISYFTLLGWIIALILHNGNKTRLGAYHLRQTLGLMVIVIAVSIFRYILNMIPFGGLIGLGLNIGLLVFWILGLISAISGQEKPIPIIGDLCQKWFAGFAL